MVSTRRKVTEAEAEDLVAAWRASNRALPAWCALQGIDGRSLRYWADRLDRTPLRLLDVTPRATAGDHLGLRLLIDDVVVEIRDGFSADTLTRLLAVVRGC
jgi:hypothetical protein